MVSSPSFPFLTPYNHRLTHPPDKRYNCIAWAAQDQKFWWWPVGKMYWPRSAPRESTLDAFVAAFETLGYKVCDSGDLEEGWEKIVLYMHAETNQPTHAARQLPSGEWTSKLGEGPVITHQTPEDINGPAYGFPAQYMRRPCR